MPVDEGVDEQRWRLVPVKGNMKELFEGEEVLAESSDPEEDAELERKTLFVYESWLAEAARKKVWRSVSLWCSMRTRLVLHACARDAVSGASERIAFRAQNKPWVSRKWAANSSRTMRANPVLRATSTWTRRRQSVCSRRRRISSRAESAGK